MFIIHFIYTVPVDMFAGFLRTVWYCNKINTLWLYIYEDIILYTSVHKLICIPDEYMLPQCSQELGYCNTKQLKNIL